MAEPDRKPLYGTDLSKPVSEIIADIRRQIVQVRGQLSDIGFAFSGWRQEMEQAEGSLTCLLVYLSWVADEAKKHEDEMSQDRQGSASDQDRGADRSKENL